MLYKIPVAMLEVAWIFKECSGTNVRPAMLKNTNDTSIITIKH